MCINFYHFSHEALVAHMSIDSLMTINVAVAVGGGGGVFVSFLYGQFYTVL